MHLIKYEREGLEAQSSAKAAGFHRVHVLQHPGDGLRRHDLQQRLAAGTRQSSKDQTDVSGMQLAQSLPGGCFVAGRDQFLNALGDPPHFLQWDCRS